MKLNFDCIYKRIDNILYQDEIPIYRFDHNFPDFEVLSEQGVKYMEDYINMWPKLCHVLQEVEDDIFTNKLLDRKEALKHYHNAVTKNKEMEINLNNTIHDFEKQNLVTISAKGGGYDILKCKVCGLKAKTTSLGRAKFDSGQNTTKITNCSFDMSSVMFVGRVIEVINCIAQGRSFSNLIPKSQHVVVEAPEPYKNDMSGVWVQGVGEPVKLLNEEFKFIEPIQAPIIEEQIKAVKQKIEKPTKDLAELKSALSITGDESHDPSVSRLEQVRFYVDKGIATTAAIARLIDANPSYVYRLVKQIQDERTKD